MKKILLFLTVLVGGLLSSCSSYEVVHNYISALNRSAKEEKDVAFITNNYIKIYNRSTELTDDEKDQIIGAIGVATASIEFWNKHMAGFGL